MRFVEYSCTSRILTAQPSPSNRQFYITPPAAADPKLSASRAYGQTFQTFGKFSEFFRYIEPFESLGPCTVSSCVAVNTLNQEQLYQSTFTRTSPYIWSQSSRSTALSSILSDSSDFVEVTLDTYAWKSEFFKMRCRTSNSDGESGSTMYSNQF